VKYVARKPKESKSNRKERKVYDGPYVGRILTSLGDDRIKRNDNHVWSGYLSPSDKLSWDMCMDEVYDRMCKPSEIDESAELVMFLGRALHEAFKNQSKWIKDFHYDFSKNIKPEFEEWQKKSWPEGVGRDNISGWVYKADDILKVDDAGEYADIVDLKSCYTNPKDWTERTEFRLPVEKDVVQGFIYGDRFEALGLVKKVRYIILDYFNVTNHLLVRGTIQYKSIVMPFDPFRYDTRLLVYHAAKHRRFALLQDRQPCDYPHCKKHGSEESTTLSRILKTIRSTTR